jgi:hypothetical protein
VKMADIPRVARGRMVPVPARRGLFGRQLRPGRI